MAKKKPKYSLKKTITKGIKIFVASGVASVIAFLETVPVAPKESLVVGAIVAGLSMISDYYKHK